ncbi:MAG: hypothetical protein ACKVOW_17040 [Chitinophagaceae bacterium]
MNDSKLPIAIFISFLLFMSAVVWMSTIRHELVIPDKKINALYSLEIAGNKEQVVYIINTWSEAGKKEFAWKINYIEFLLIPGYTAFLFFGVRLLAIKWPNPFKKVLKFLIVMAILPGILDIIEGAGIFLWLSGTVDSITPVIVEIVSFLKFLVVIPMALLVIGGFLFAFLKKVTKR